MNRIIVDIKYLSGYLKISDSEIRKLVRSKRIPFFRIGNRIKFDLKEIDNWVNELQDMEGKNPLYMW